MRGPKPCTASEHLVNDPRTHRAIGVVSDSTTDGLRLANAFQTAVTDQHGTVAGRFDGTLGLDVYTPSLASWGDAAAVFYGGTSVDEAAAIRLAMDQAGLTNSLLLTTDGVFNGAWVGDNWYLGLAGDGAKFTRAARAVETDYSGREGFESWYLHTSRQPVGDYSAAAFACTQVILDAIAKASTTGQPTRELVRQAAMDPSATVQSVFGQLTFDENGDNRTQAVTVYSADPQSSGPAWQRLQQRLVGLCPGSLNAPCWPSGSPSALSGRAAFVTLGAAPQPDQRRRPPSRAPPSGSPSARSRRAG